MMPTPDGLRAQLHAHLASTSIQIAYSGGLDSHVLLHLASRLTDCLPPITALHVHHGLQPDAEHWVEHCGETCLTLGIPLEVLRVDARHAPGDSPEESARRARYGALAGRLRAGGLLLTAQHRDDQAETLLLQLLRGGGLAGMAAMPRCAELGAGHLLRPLLDFDREELRAYAEFHRLRWIEDPSNADPRYDRNFLRQQILPVLQQRWPGLTQVLSRTAAHCAEDLSTLREISQALLDSVRSDQAGGLCVSKLRGLRASDQTLVVRHWLRENQLRMPSDAVLQAILNEVLNAAPDRNPRVSWSEGEVRRYRDRMVMASPEANMDVRRVIAWDGKESLELPDGNGLLQAQPGLGHGVKVDFWKTARIEIRYRQGGERARLPGRQGERELKKLFQEAGVAPWLRHRIPLIFMDDRLACVPGLWVFDPYAAGAGECAIQPLWTPSPMAFSPVR
jgi:tRNA(Ile)-lysidine synthase